MKEMMVIIAAVSCALSYSALAKVTLEDGYASEAEYWDSVKKNRAEYEKDLYTGLEVPENPSNSVKVVEFSTGAETTSIITKTLKPVNGWVCSLSGVSGYYGRGLKGTDAKVYQSSGYWKLTSGRASCGGCAVSAKATCWEVQ
ncbi:hypothetical protein AB4425_17310 [Vibrio sp. 10N.261.51.A1]|uniref:hypothetical protein n=1 Tax=unclassified Vibrio TaxID=2614977 RepID=UPI003553B7D6